MKVLIINTLYYPYKVGGAEVSVQLLAEGLIELGYEVTVLSLTDKNKKYETTVNNVRNIAIPIPNFYWPYSNKNISKGKKIIWHLCDQFNVKAFSITKQVLKSIKPDIVHTNNLAGWSTSVWVASKLSGCKIVHTSRDYYLLHPNSSLFKNGENMTTASLEVRFFSFLKKKLSKYVNGYVGISNFIGQLHLDAGFFGMAKHTTIYNAVDNKVSTSNLQGKISFADVKRIGFIGRMSEEKGFDIFCQIAKLYSEKYHFVSAGAFVNEQDEIYFNENFKCNVSLLGTIPINKFLNQVDAVIIPVKWNEPFGRVIVECAKAGKFVLTSPLGGITELKEIFSNVYVSDNWLCDFKRFQNNNANFDIKQFESLPNDVSFDTLDIARKYDVFYKKILED